MENPFELILERLNTIENLIKSLKKIDPVLNSPVNEILNMNEAAAYLGLTKSYLYKMTSSRMIPHSKLGKKIIFWRNELYDWISAHKVKTNTEIEQEANEYLVKRKTYSR